MKIYDALRHLFNIEWLSTCTSKIFKQHYIVKIVFVLIAIISLIIVLFLNNNGRIMHPRWFVMLKNTNMSIEDIQLSNRLIEIAKSRSNRYYLHDFAYFRMIRNQFPRTDSAARINLGSYLMPLLSTKLNSKDVLFIVMGSVAHTQRAIQIVETWLRWSQNNFFIFADADNSSIPFTTLPELKNKSTYTDAQHRQLIGSQWLMRKKSEIVKRTKWFVFVDDDTWVNVPALFSYLQYFDHRLRLSIGYVWDNTWVPGWSYFSGGSGIVLSHAAFIEIIPTVYTLQCLHTGFNDITIGQCAKEKGVLKIHSDRFYYNSVFSYNTFPHFGHHVSFHYVNESKTFKMLTCTVAALWKWPIKGCNITYSEK